jgi:hypothetical protein
MVIESFYPVHISFKEHVLRPESFFIFRLITAIWQIPVISMEIYYMTEKFSNHMIEISSSDGLIFLFILSLLPLYKYLGIYIKS